ncbi:MAG: TetR/AcrR family transcriptional regulator [Streptosporangiaceae bacterium]
MPPPPSATPGRPRNAAATRERIAAAARPLFAERGFEATTVHAIARSAQVSPNLITRYFGGKDGLFLAASDVRFDLAAAFGGPRSSFGERVAHNLVARWAELGMNDPLPILLRSAGGQPTAASALADFLSQNAIGPITTQLLAYGMSREDAAERAAVVHALVLGAVFIRRVLHSTALDTMDDAELERSLGRSIQALVDH